MKVKLTFDYQPLRCLTKGLNDLGMKCATQSWKDLFMGYNLFMESY
jgi:hypothetical protein